MERDDQQLFQEAVSRGHEIRDVRARRALAYALALMLAVPVIMFILWQCYYRGLAGPGFTGLTQPVIAAAINSPARVYPQPQLIRVPGALLRDYRAREGIELTNYGWISRTQNVTRIPIDRAMTIIVQRGLPVRQPGVTNIDSSEYELVIKRRLDRDKAIREGKPLEE